MPKLQSCALNGRPNQPKRMASTTGTVTSFAALGSTCAVAMRGTRCTHWAMPMCVYSLSLSACMCKTQPSINLAEERRRHHARKVRRAYHVGLLHCMYCCSRAMGSLEALQKQMNLADSVLSAACSAARAPLDISARRKCTGSSHHKAIQYG